MLPNIPGLDRVTRNRCLRPGEEARPFVEHQHKPVTVLLAPFNMVRQRSGDQRPDQLQAFVRRGLEQVEKGRLSRRWRNKVTVGKGKATAPRRVMPPTVTLVDKAAQDQRRQFSRSDPCDHRTEWPNFFNLVAGTLRRNIAEIRLEQLGANSPSSNATERSFLVMRCRASLSAPPVVLWTGIVTLASCTSSWRSHPNNIAAVGCASGATRINRRTWISISSTTAPIACSGISAANLNTQRSTQMADPVVLVGTSRQV